MKNILKIDDNIIEIRLNKILINKLLKDGDMGIRCRPEEYDDKVLIIRYKEKWDDK